MLLDVVPDSLEPAVGLVVPTLLVGAAPVVPFAPPLALEVPLDVPD